MLDLVIRADSDAKQASAEDVAAAGLWRMRLRMLRVLLCLAIVRAHNLWTWRWPVIITLTGWVTLISGLWRMAMPAAPQMAENVLTYAVLATIIAFGAILSVKAYGSEVSAAQKPSDD